jgi:hypothetical protein
VPSAIIIVANLYLVINLDYESVREFVRDDYGRDNKREIKREERKKKKKREDNCVINFIVIFNRHRANLSTSNCCDHRDLYEKQGDCHTR